MRFIYLITSIIFIEFVHLAYASDWVVDDADVHSTDIEGTWTVQSDSDAYDGVRLHDNDSDKGTKWIRMRPDLPSFGRYNVSIWHGEDSGLTLSYPVDISGWEGVESLMVSQSGGSGAFGWELMSIGFFRKGTFGYVEVSNSGTSGNVPVDAIKFSSREPEPVIAMGENFSIVLSDDEQCWTWGQNGEGQLGNGSGSNSKKPVLLSGTSDWKSVGAGREHGLLVKTDGTVLAWGENGRGQLGDGSTTDRSTPVTVSGLSDVVQVDGGYEHSIALKSDGTVWCWGRNRSGELGIGNQNQKTTPVQVIGLQGAIQVVAGKEYSMALLVDGTVWAWGTNSNGQLGDGSTSRRELPVQVKKGSGYLTDVVFIASGYQSSYAVLSNGGLMCWGSNEFGQFGNGDYGVTTNKKAISSPVSGVLKVAGGNNHSLILKSNGTLMGAGQNKFLQLGDNTYYGWGYWDTYWGYGYYNTEDFVTISNAPSGIIDIASHYNSNLIQTENEVYSFGANDNGILGLDHFGTVSDPSQVGTIDLSNNVGPSVDLPASQTIEMVDGGTIAPDTILDDGFPNIPGSVLCAWTQDASGDPGMAYFWDETAATTTVSFSALGTYTLRLDVSDGEFEAFDEMTVTVVDSDDDGDGLSNMEELGLGTNRYSSDSDGDGIGDYDEINAWNTDPLDDDSDDDGVTDGVEVILGIDPLDTDSDDDGLDDGDEVNAGFDPTSDDEDGNGNLDSLDDFDGDGVTNAQEISNGTPMNDYYDGQRPMVELVSGDLQVLDSASPQSGAITFVIKQADGSLWKDKRVKFFAPSDIAKISSSSGGTYTSELEIDSNSTTAEITLYVKLD